MVFRALVDKSKYAHDIMCYLSNDKNYKEPFIYGYAVDFIWNHLDCPTAHNTLSHKELSGYIIIPDTLERIDD